MIRQGKQVSSPQISKIKTQSQIDPKDNKSKLQNPTNKRRLITCSKHSKRAAPETVVTQISDQIVEYSKLKADLQFESKKGQSLESELRKILTVQIDLGSGKFEQIVVMPTDDPITVATTFCGEQGFSLDLVTPLAEEIQRNMDKFFKSTILSPVSNTPIHEKTILETTESVESDDNQSHLIKTQLEDPTQLTVNNWSRTLLSPQRPDTLGDDFTNQFSPSDIEKQNQTFEDIQPSLLQQLAQRTHIFGRSAYSQLRERKVYDRLFDAAKRKHAHQEAQIRRQNKPLVKPNTKSQQEVQDIGNRMYLKTLLTREQRKSEIMNQQQQAASRALDDCTFIPVVNSPTSSQGRKRVINRATNYGLEIENRLLQAKDETQEKLKLIRMKKEKEQVQGLFKPTVTAHSTSILQKKPYTTITIPNLKWGNDFFVSPRSHTSKDQSKKATIQTQSATRLGNFKNATDRFEDEKYKRFHLLHEDSKLRLERKNQVYGNYIDNQCTFKPTLISKHKSEVNLINAKRTVRTDTEEIFTFSPRINSNDSRSARERRKSSLDRSLHLYKQALDLAEKKQQMLLSSQLSSPRVTKKSEALVTENKLQAFTKIFKSLVQGEDQILKTSKMSKESLPVQIQSIYTPLFDELQEIEEGIDFGEFMDASNRLYETLDQHSRSVLVRLYRQINKQKYEETIYSFHPQTHSSSSTRLKERQNIDMYRRQLERKISSNQRLEQAREIKMKQEIESCTFQPNIERRKKLNSSSSFSYSFRETSTLNQQNYKDELRASPESTENNIITQLSSVNIKKLGQVLETDPTLSHRLYEDNESNVSETENRNVIQPVEAPHYF